MTIVMQSIGLKIGESPFYVCINCHSTRGVCESYLTLKKTSKISRKLNIYPKVTKVN